MYRFLNKYNFHLSGKSVQFCQIAVAHLGFLETSKLLSRGAISFFIPISIARVSQFSFIFVLSFGIVTIFLFSVQFSRSVVSDSLWPHELQHTRPPCPLPTPGVHPNPRPLSQCCHPTISSSVIPFFSCLLSYSASGSFLMSQFFASFQIKTSFPTCWSIYSLCHLSVLSWNLSWCPFYLFIFHHATRIVRI